MCHTTNRKILKEEKKMSNKKSPLISGVAGCALLGASMGCFVSMIKNKKTPMHKTAGSAIKTVGSIIERMHF